MANIRITDLLNSKAKPPLLGKLVKGSPKSERTSGRDLKHFRFVPNPEFEDKEIYPSSLYPGKSLAEELEISFAEKFGAEPNYLRVRFPHSLWRENFVIENNIWAMAGGKAKKMRQCDGTTCTLWKDSNGMSLDPIPCSMKEGDWKCPEGCKTDGIFDFHLPDWGRVGIVKFQTHSDRDINNLISSSKPFIEQDISRVPFMLYRKVGTRRMPAEGGVLKQKEYWFVHLDLDQSAIQSIKVEPLDPSLYQPKPIVSTEDMIRDRLYAAADSFGIERKRLPAIASKVLGRTINRASDVQSAEECYQIELEIHRLSTTQE